MMADVKTSDVTDGDHDGHDVVRVLVLVVRLMTETAWKCHRCFGSGVEC